MAERAWFFASEGKQQGPYPENQLRDFAAKGTVTADTLVWSEGMSGWQKAAEIPGLLSGASSPPTMSGAMPRGEPPSGGQVSAEFSIWALLGRSLLLLIGTLLVIPTPWVATSFYRWFIERLRVPQRPNLGFTGKPGDIWYVFIILALCTYAGLVTDVWYVPYLLLPLQAFLSWMTVRWIVANISSDGRPLSLTFEGSVWGYIGWYLLLFISFITIIGWAWVTTAWMRWICGNVAGTRRAIVFNASGWGVLWRTLLFVLGCFVIIPIPWVLGWYVRWYLSQFSLGERAV